MTRLEQPAEISRTLVASTQYRTVPRAWAMVSPSASAAVPSVWGSLSAPRARRPFFSGRSTIMSTQGMAHTAMIAARMRKLMRQPN